MKNTQKYNEFIKALDIGEGKYKKKDVFIDFVATMALGINNKYYKDIESEKYVWQIIEKYTNIEREKFLLLSYKLRQLYNSENEIVDILGEIYTELNAKNKELGQDFTPQSITRYMTKVLQINEKIIEKQGYITLIEPSCRFRYIYIGNGKSIKKGRL